MAPIYHRYPLAFRLKGDNISYILKSGVDITTWLPGDIIFTEDIQMPKNAAAGNYMLQTAITGRFDDKPAIKIASGDRNADGWHDVGRVIIE